MKRLLVSFALVGVMASSASAISTIGFRTYSSATAMSCSVMAGDTNITAKDYFVPFTGNSTVLSLGTKGTSAYTVKGNDAKLLITCFPTVAGLGSTTTTRTPVKMFFDSSETFYFPVTEMFKLSVN